MLSGKAKSRLVAIATVFAVFAAANALQFLPIYRPLVGEAPPWKEARALVKEGNCAQGVALYERLGREGDEWAYNSLGRIFLLGQCGSFDISRAIHYYRLAAANGHCESNAVLAKIALNFPKVDGITHVPPERNFLTAALCSGESDSALRQEFFDGEFDGSVPEAFLVALAERKKLLNGPASKLKRIAQQIAGGEGFDRNPSLRKNLK